MRPNALTLANEIGISGEHPDYPVLDWQEEVRKGNTREGYWDWVVLSMEYDKHGWLDD